jgi:hypothetical protein
MLHSLTRRLRLPTLCRDRALCGLLVVFLVSRVLAHGNGVGIDLEAHYQWQLLEPALLESRFGESLWNLHSQPPLFNALHGLVLKLFASPGERVLAWTGLQLSFGLVILVCLYGTLRRLEVGPWTSAVLTTLFCCSPAALAYENFLSYTYLDTALLSVAAFALACFVKHGRKLAIWGFFLALSLLCLTRSTYHGGWLLLVAIVLLLWWQKREGTFHRHMACAAVVSVLIVGGLYLKNYQLFGFVGPSSWVGMNLATMTHTNLDQAARQELERSGRASSLTLTDPFQPLASYPEAFRSQIATGVPVLDLALRFDGSPNFNHRDFIRLSRQYGRDAAAVAIAYPTHYLRSVLRNVASFVFRSSSDYRLIDDNMDQMRRWEAIHSVFVYGQLGAITKVFASNDSPPENGVLKHLSLQRVILQKGSETCLLLAALVIGLPVYCLRKIRRPTGDHEPLVFIFIGLTLAYVVAATLLANFGEAQRMRFEIEPLFVLLLGLALRDWQLLRRSRFARPLSRA